MIKRWLLTVTSCSVDTDHWPGAETHVRSVSVISVLSCTMIQYQVSRVNNIIRSLAPGLQGHILWPDKLFDPDKRWSEMCWRREVSAGVCKPANILSSTLTLSLISEASQFILCQRYQRMFPSSTIIWKRNILMILSLIPAHSHQM